MYNVGKNRKTIANKDKITSQLFRNCKSLLGKREMWGNLRTIFVILTEYTLWKISKIQ